MTAKQLLDLPTELFHIIFQYLDCVEILKIFAILQSDRIQALLQSFISRLDISGQQIRWIERYLPDVLAQWRIVGLRLRDNQISCVSKYLSLSEIQSMEVISLDSNDEIPGEDLVELRRYLKKLTIKILCSMNRERERDRDEEFHYGDIKVPYFSYSGRFFHPDNNRVYDWPHLTYLSIKVDVMNDVFIILYHLPNLEDLKVNLHYSHFCSRRTTDVQDTISCKTLRRVTLAGVLNYSPLFTRFFAVYGSTIESLKLDIDFESIKLNVSELEDHLLNKMPLLSSLELLIYWCVPYLHDSQYIASWKDPDDVMDIKSFQTAPWQKFNPIVHWHNVINSYHEICTLPHINHDFTIYSNEFVSTCATNRPVSLCLENVHTLLMYLRSIDIFKALYDIPSRRLQALIQPFLIVLDISQESNEWIESYLTHFLLRKEITTLRLQMKHLLLILDDLSASAAIQSIDVINWDFASQFSVEVMTRLRQSLKRLSLTFAELGEIVYDDVPFLQSDSQLEQLTINHCVLIYANAKLEICSRLTYLSISVEGMQPLFLFIKHTPNLQQLKVHIVSQECFRQDPPDINRVQPCKTLRIVSFTGWIKYFDHLESFFATFGSTIEFLSLEIRLMFLTVDGIRLEHKLLDKMPRLESLHLNIFSTFSDEEPIQIETFKSFSWEQVNPIVYWYDIHAQQQTLFTLPYKSHRFEHLSSEFVSTCVSNRTVSLDFHRVRILSLINTTPLNLETFLLIEKLFFKITTVELREKDIHPLAESEDDEEERSIDILSMDEDLLCNTTLQISSVTKFSVDVQQQRIDYKTFHRFLRLFPNLVNLELNIGQPFLRDLLKHKHDLIETALARINQLTISNWHETDTWTDADIHYLFPNVTNIIKPEDVDFYE